jgi:predicted phage terminase large subunit-like protein
VPTLDELLDPQDFSLERILGEICGEQGGFPSEQLEKARTSLIEFSQFIDPSFQVNWHHRLIAEKLEAVADGRIKKLMVLTAPRHGKTLLCSQHFPAWLLGRQDEAIVGCAYNSTKATEESANVQRLIASDRYQAVFPNARIPSRSNAQKGLKQGAGKFALVDRPRANYRAVGIGEGLTGFDKTLGIIDDPTKDREEALSETIQRKGWDWFHSVFRSRDTEIIAGPQGIRDIVVQTCWSESDMAGRLIESEGDDWTIVRLPAFLTADTWQLRDAQDPRQPMEALWPAAKNMDALLKLQAQRPDVFQALYQQRPTSGLGTIFKRERFVHRYRPNELSKNRGHWFISVDAAFEGTDTSDRVAIQVWCVDFDLVRAYLVLDNTMTRTFTETLLALQATLKAYPQCTELLIEKAANGAAIISTLQNKIGQICTPFKPVGSKVARALGAQPYVDVGCVWLPESAVWLQETLDEICKFPRAKFDDRADAFSMALTKLANSPLSGQDAWEALMKGR